MYEELTDGIKSGQIVPYLGAGALKDVTNRLDGSPIPADSDSLILAMNGGQPMAPRLMYEFPRAAMSMENKKGRSFVTRFLNETYGEKQWSRGQLHDWLAALKPNYVVDINRDTQLLDSYADTEHTLIMGVARIMASEYRFKLFHYDGSIYKEIALEAVNPALPILFKPHGAPKPEANYIAADADFVDYITELMGGFAIPAFLKEYRQHKQYLFLGMRFNRDTERMVMSDIIYAADEPAGWAFIPEPTDKERRFCKLKKIEIIEEDWDALIGTKAALALA
ncbi:hypothetical protein ADIMK_3055 [Marinobacterium lacunae]|uniref:Uncharacterized protein n=1 Tax=Marinobacterium lacunae TaxID=1232683 RepID=A0A081FVM8_9GAMM|nr:SIR2 family protein [Marinobacterium lacunae]KEA62583.1 hypothetical protein ADIMK_3055 [Marinobacterium lacunae]MBR9884051.1 SIR2 family protein [Oceanospirillales bacterium]